MFVSSRLGSPAFAKLLKALAFVLPALSGCALASDLLLEVIVIRLTVVMVGSRGGKDRLLKGLRSLMIGTRLEEGCLECTAWCEADSSVHYYEEWATNAHMERRVRTDRFTSLLSMIESSKERPFVRFDFVSETRGIDYIAEIRQEPSCAS